MRRRLVEEGKADAAGDWPDVERALEYPTAVELPGVPPMKRVFEHPPENADREALLAQPRRAERYAGISRLARAGISRRRRATRRRRMVASRFLEIDGRVDGAGRLWPDELSPARGASRAVHEERGVGDPGQAALLRDRDAAAHRRDCRSWSRRTMVGRPRSMAIRSIPRVVARPTLFAQASILDLYDPARSKRFVEQGERTPIGGDTYSKNI